MPAPVALFVYNRPGHTQQTLDALADNVLSKDTELFIFADGPKAGASSEDLKNIEAVRAIARNEKRFAKINIVESPVNKGLASSIINGINHVLEKHEKIIVLEDDILTSKYFLRYCNDALEKYKSEARIMAISGFTHPAGKNLPDTFFLSIVACWGWATWKDRWQQFNQDAVFLLNEIEKRNKVAEFNFNNSFDYHDLLKSQVAGRVNSWAVRWYASIFLKGGLALYPSTSLTKNIGLDGSGTHYSKDVSQPRNMGVIISNEDYDRSSFFTTIIATDKKTNKKFEKYLRISNAYGLRDKIKARAKNIFS